MRKVFSWFLKENPLHTGGAMTSKIMGTRDMYGYKERKAAQVAAYFVLKSNGKINVLKLAKLLYLAERENMAQYDEPLFFDRLVSMDHGPVTSITLSLLNGYIENPSWTSLIADRDQHDIGVVQGIDFASLDDLSGADIELLNQLWSKFCDFGRFEIRDWTHMHCPEWENPFGSSEKIPHVRIFTHLGKANPAELAAVVDRHRYLSSALSGE